MDTSLINLLGHLSFFASATSFLMKDIIFLRILAIVSSVLGIIYNYWVTTEPLWLVIFWLSLFLIINLLQIARLIRDNTGISLSDEEQFIHEILFSSFSTFEFKKLVHAAEWKESNPGDVLALEGKELNELKFIYAGEVGVYKENRELTKLRDGALIGELSYLQDTSASATVITIQKTKYLCWEKTKLRNLLSKNPTMNISMMAAMNSDLIQKLRG